MTFVQAFAEEVLRGILTAVTCTHRIGYTHLRGTMGTKTSGKLFSKEARSIDGVMKMQPSPVGWVSTGDGKLPRKAVLKMIVVGDGGVGKTTLIHRFLTGNYLDQRMTVGSGFATRDLKMEGVTITLTIWDFAGEERFRFLLPSYCRGSLGCILAFDLTRPPTFYHLDEWLNLVRNHTDNIPILLVGTKRDVGNKNGDLALDYAKINNLAGYLETSSKLGLNIIEVFKTISTLMWNRVTTADPSSVIQISV